MNRGVGLALLAIVGGAIGAFAVAIGAGGALLGFLWLFVFGDDPWPPWAETVLNLAIPIAGLLLWPIIGWKIGLQLRGLADPPAAG